MILMQTQVLLVEKNVSGKQSRGLLLGVDLGRALMDGVPSTLEGSLLLRARGGGLSAPSFGSL